MKIWGCPYSLYRIFPNDRWKESKKSAAEMKCNNRTQEGIAWHYTYIISWKTGSPGGSTDGINSGWLRVSVREIRFVCDWGEIIELQDIRVLLKHPTLAMMISPLVTAISRGAKNPLNFREGGYDVSGIFVSRFVLVGINDHAVNGHKAKACFFPFLPLPLNLVAGNTTLANLRVRGTQDRYSPSTGILQVSWIPIGGSQLSDKPVSRLPPSFADRLASRVVCGNTERSSFPRQEYQKQARIS